MPLVLHFVRYELSLSLPRRGQTEQRVRLLLETYIESGASIY